MGMLFVHIMWPQYMLPMTTFFLECSWFLPPHLLPALSDSPFNYAFRLLFQDRSQALLSASALHSWMCQDISTLQQDWGFNNVFKTMRLLRLKPPWNRNASPAQKTRMTSHHLSLSPRRVPLNHTKFLSAPCIFQAVVKFRVFIHY